MQKRNSILIFLFIIGLIFSGINPHDYFTWLMEIFPSIFGFFILIYTYRKFQFSSITYYLILVHSYILFIGGHYTYAEVPLFDWIKEVLNQSRNNYDKVGHFAQGFIPAFIVRELFIRKKIVLSKNWLSILTISVCLSISVLYEFLEWMVALLTGESADAFLGTQGYIWDTQSDMFFAFIGAVSMISLFSKIHNKQIKNLDLES